MFQMRMYSERTVVMKNITTKTGEDAFPFVNKAGMFVADGIGGSAGVRIVSLDERCFEPDELSKMLCDDFGLKKEEQIEEFSAYVKTNFDSLSNPVMKELYENPGENMVRLKKSGYIGSHALGTALTAYLIRLSSWLDSGEADLANWQAKVEEIRETIFDCYEHVIKCLGSECARVSMDKIQYYGTTLAGVFFKENETSVDAIFINCGDSRNYVWDKNGFRQACDDQGRDGGMEAFFSTSPEAPVNISLSVKRFEKPCTFFSMTDGFYEVYGGIDGFHSTPLYMDAFLMATFSSRSSLDEVRERLQAIYDKRGGNTDDSNSIVMASFGYENYEELQKAAAERYEFLCEEYGIKEMPEDFFRVDYQKKFSDLQKSFADSMKPLLDEAYREEAIHNYCLAKAGQAGFGTRYRETFQTIEDRICEIRRKNEEIRRSLVNIAGKNFIDFVDMEDTEQAEKIFERVKRFVGVDKYSEAQRRRESFHADCSRRSATLRSLVKMLELSGKTMQSRIESLAFSEDEIWTSIRDEDILKWIRETKQLVHNVGMQLQSSLVDLENHRKNLLRDCDQWYETNFSLMATYRDRGGACLPKDLVEEWLEGALKIEEIIGETSIPYVKQDILSLVREYQDNQERISGLESEKSRIKEQSARAYWDENGCTEIYDLLKSDIYFAKNIDLKLRFKEWIRRNEEFAKYENLATKQQEIFEKYMQMHFSEVSEEKRNDVIKNGWM